jgi:hypothetical protein
MQLLRFVLIAAFKILCRFFFRYEVTWVNDTPLKKWNDVRLYAFFNHTSLFEPLFISAMPFHFIWKGCKHAIVPAADKTMNRKIVGKLFLLMAPHMVSITRKKDESWSGFLDKVDDNSIICIAPEGRMKRRNGLDAQGQPMSVRGGISDILLGLDEGLMLLGYSGGLHHVQAPGEKSVRLFKTVKICYEAVSIRDYKAQFNTQNSKEFKIQVVRDLETRMKKHVPR